MKLLHNLKRIDDPRPQVRSNYNAPEEIEDIKEPISFDGIYYNVYENRELLKGKDVILFVMGDWVGLDNSTLDPEFPVEDYCTWDEIMEMAKDGAKIGWHTWSHPDLTKLSYEEILKEVTPPFPMDYFAYPYGKYNADVIRAVKEAGFKKAWSVTQGNDNDFTLRRDYL